MASGFVQSLREHIRGRNYSKRTEQTYVYWAVYPSTQKTALNALMCLFKRFLGREVLDLGEFTRSSREKRLPVVLSKTDVRRLLSHLEAEPLMRAQLMYGSGLRIMEVCRLRVKDIDVDVDRLTVAVTR